MMSEPTADEKCPRCGEGRMRSWNELSAEERELVRRLPASAGYTLAERQGRHLWCPRCWYEETSGAPRRA
jgi:rRNA maturation protein Nop10